MAKYNSNALLILVLGLTIITSGCTGGQDATPATTDTIPTTTQTSVPVGAPAVSMVAGNFPDTPETDLAIVHKGGDPLRGGEWKLSVVPSGNQPEYVVSAPGSDVSFGKGILAISTSERASLIENVLVGEVMLTSGTRYDVKLVHVPSGAMLLDTLVEVKGTTAGAAITPASTQVTAPTAGVIVSNFPDTPAYDLKIKHIGGDTLKGKDWKLSVVPVGNPLRYVTSDSDFAVGDQIVATSTTEGAAGLTNSSLTGGGALASSAVYDIKLVHIPSKALIVDMTVEVR